MTLIRNGYAALPRRGFLGVVCSGLLALALLHPGAASAQDAKQMKLTEKQVQSFIAGHKDLAKMVEGLNPDKPNPKAEAAVEAAAKKYGFASLDEYDEVSGNIQLVMSGIDPDSKKFSEPPEAIKKQIEEVKADKSMKPADKKAELAELAAALKDAKPVQFKENIALVTKYFDKLSPLMQD